MYVGEKINDHVARDKNKVTECDGGEKCHKETYEPEEMSAQEFYKV